jgi:DEAD/DEAH box helicase domain-containing protein
MSISSLLSRWRAEPTIGSNIVEWKKIPERYANLIEFPNELDPAVKCALQDSGINALYSHQAEVWHQVKAGNNPILVTGTASGKTLAYNLPILDTLTSNHLARALYLFPTKALAQDQENKLLSITELIHDFEINNNCERDFSANDAIVSTPRLLVGVYDGDTPSQIRSSLRAKSNIILSNPDMLHAGILPYHTKWADFFHNLNFIVIDEVHTYRGVFGSHVANVLRRLKRICKHYKSKPQFILTSATIANPVDFATRLIEKPAVLINDDGSSRGPKHFIIYNPPIIDEEFGIRKSAIHESVRLTQDLLAYNIQTIVFGRTRRVIEIILTYLRGNETENEANDVQDNQEHIFKIRGYRSGYLPKQRREIEQGLRTGDVRLVVATNALELGIDIGKMGASVLTGYPGTIAATWQQAGRAGREIDSSLTIMITTSSPVDQFLAHHPDYFFERNPEQALINPDNLLILLEHLRCATFEIPFEKEENFGKLSKSQLLEILVFLTENGELYSSGSKYFWMSDRFPSHNISLRSASPDRFSLQVTSDGSIQTIGEIDGESAAWMVHPQAVYLHEAQTYLVNELDLNQKIAKLQRKKVDYYTQTNSETKIELDLIINEVRIKGSTKSFGEVTVTTKVTSFQKIRWLTHERFDRTDLDLPPSVLHTTAYWLALSEETTEKLRQMGAWSSDPNQYGSNWKIQRERARSRDKYQCQICGIVEKDRSHDVHHITPFRYFQSEVLANQLDNLITLCPSCHRKAESAVRVKSGLAGLSYTIGNLAPLFLMCESRDLGIFSDPKSLLSDGKPSIIIYDQVPAGIGFSEKLFEIHDELIERAEDLIQTCECQNGCPSCVGPAGESFVGGKMETLAILSQLLKL